jgi:uncharacterized membrane protein YkvA (DUF1232 family)
MPFIESIKTWARKIKRDAITLWFACKHPRTPLSAKLVSVLVVTYALSPIDPIPDFIPVLGFVDEAIVLPALIWLALKLIPADVLQECRASGEAWMEREGKKPRSYVGAALIIAIWMAVAWCFWRFVLAPVLQ